MVRYKMLNSCRIWSPTEPHTLPLSTVCIYSILIQQGRGGGWTREKGRRATQESIVQITKLGWKYQHDWMYTRIGYLQTINPQSPCTVKFFRWRHFALPSMSLIFLRIFTCFRNVTGLASTSSQLAIINRRSFYGKMFYPLAFDIQSSFCWQCHSSLLDIVNSAHKVERWTPTGRTWPHRTKTPHSWIRWFVRHVGTFVHDTFLKTWLPFYLLSTSKLWPSLGKV